jgi:DNA-binding transcriptional LysR family regulator
VTALHALAGAGIGVGVAPALSACPDDPHTVIADLGHILAPRRVGVVWHTEHAPPALDRLLSTRPS